MFSTFDLTKEDDPATNVDFKLLSEMFCRRQEDIDAEEAERQKATTKSKEGGGEAARSVLDIKFVTDVAMALASLRVPSGDVLDALSTLDDFALNPEQISKLALVIPTPEQEKLLEENRHCAHELSKEEQYLLEILKVPGIGGHLNCMEIKFNFSERFLSVNKSLQGLRKGVFAVEENPELKLFTGKNQHD